MDYAADDFSTIAQRLREIREEKERARRQKANEPAAAEDDEFYGLLGYAG